MSLLSVFRHTAVLACMAAVTTGFPQDLPIGPPLRNPNFWGRAYKPYILKLTVMNASANGSGAPQTTEENVYRDSAGRVCTESFYSSGKLSGIMISDPIKSTILLTQAVTKRVWSMPSHYYPPQIGLWTVERLPSRLIAGYPAEGFRFTRTVPPSADGKRPPDKVSEEEWISSELAVVLERKYVSQLIGTTTETVSHFQATEPDPTLFAIPNDYISQPTGASTSP